MLLLLLLSLWLIDNTRVIAEVNACLVALGLLDLVKACSKQVLELLNVVVLALLRLQVELNIEAKLIDISLPRLLGGALTKGV